MLFFAGFAVGTFGAGLISDRYGRKSAIILMAQLLFGCGILTASMGNMVGFTIMWFFTGSNNRGILYCFKYLWFFLFILFMPCNYPYFIFIF